MGGFPGHFKHDLIGTIGIPFPSKIHYKVSRKTIFAIFSILIIMVEILKSDGANKSKFSVPLSFGF